MEEIERIISALKVWGMQIDSIPYWQKLLLQLITPVLKNLVVNALKITESGAKDGLVKSKAFFKEVDELLADGRQYIMGAFKDYFFSN